MKKANILDHYALRHMPFLHGGGRPATDQMISLLNLKGTEKILEIGFGTGATQVRLKSLYPKIDIYGLELSSIMMDQARKRFKFAGLAPINLQLLDQGNLKIPYNTNSFDVVLYESVTYCAKTLALDVFGVAGGAEHRSDGRAGTPNGLAPRRAEPRTIRPPGASEGT